MSLKILLSPNELNCPVKIAHTYLASGNILTDADGGTSNVRGADRQAVGEIVGEIGGQIEIGRHFDIVGSIDKGPIFSRVTLSFRGIAGAFGFFVVRFFRLFLFGLLLLLRFIVFLLRFVGMRM